MIAYLKGRIQQKMPGQVVLDIGGVGYCAHIPLSTYLNLGDEGSLCELHIYTHLTDSALALYGFSKAEEKEVFLKLIGISGIGPKLALNVLSGIGPAELLAEKTAGASRRTEILAPDPVIREIGVEADLPALAVGHHGPPSRKTGEADFTPHPPIQSTSAPPGARKPLLSKALFNSILLSSPAPLKLRRNLLSGRPQGKALEEDMEGFRCH